MDLGFVKEGFEILWANDIEPWACRTYEKNFGPHMVEGDIVDIDPNEIPDCDVMLGGFPCQDFSMIWKRGGLTTDRGNLYTYFVKAVTAKKPKIFIAENVRGLLTANKGKAIEQITNDFANVGYKVKPHLVNFADYGAPQLRKRVLIIGVRNDINEEFHPPEPTHNENTYVTAKEALKNVEKVKHNNNRQNITSRTVEKLKLIPPGGNYTDIPKDSPHYVKGMISHVYRRLHPDKPSTTIIAAGGGGTWGYHYREPRSLTNRERARLFGYPDNFLFVGTLGQVRRQVGNSVPPVGIRPFAREIHQFLTNLDVLKR